MNVSNNITQHQDIRKLRTPCLLAGGIKIRTVGQITSLSKSLFVSIKQLSVAKLKPGKNSIYQNQLQNLCYVPNVVYTCMYNVSQKVTSVFCSCYCDHSIMFLKKSKVPHKQQSHVKSEMTTPQSAGQLLLHVVVTQQPLVHVLSEMHTSGDSIHPARQL